MEKSNLNHVRRGIIPGNSKTLWYAVKKAKDQNITPIPDILTLKNVPINLAETGNLFAEFFQTKSKTL